MVQKEKPKKLYKKIWYDSNDRDIKRIAYYHDEHYNKLHALVYYNEDRMVTKKILYSRTGTNLPYYFKYSDGQLLDYGYYTLKPIDDYVPLHREDGPAFIMLNKNGGIMHTKYYLYDKPLQDGDSAHLQIMAKEHIGKMLDE